MVGGHVDEAGARVGGHELAGQERAGLGKEAAACVHRVAGGGICEIVARELTHYGSLGLHTMHAEPASKSFDKSVEQLACYYKTPPCN